MGARRCFYSVLRRGFGGQLDGLGRRRDNLCSAICIGLWFGDCVGIRFGFANVTASC